MGQTITNAWVIFREGETGPLSIQRIFDAGDYDKAAYELTLLSRSIEARYFLLRVMMTFERMPAQEDDDGARNTRSHRG